jgi:integrase
MPKLRHSFPSYRRHRASGQAVVTLGGKDIYLGKYNSANSRAEYSRLIAEWAARGGTVPQTKSCDLTVAELLAAFLQHVQRYYVKTDGTPSSEQAGYRLAIRRVLNLYGRTRVAEFGPLSLKTVRQAMIDDQLSRGVINQLVNRIRRMFKWGVENELVPATTLHALQAVAGLRYGRREARETEPVRPVPDAFVDAVLPHVSAPVAAMIQLQRITGMRSGEVTVLRACEINMARKVWMYTPHHHKTSYRGHVRQVYLGPKAQDVIRPFLRMDTAAYLFSPQLAMQSVRERRHAQRKVPASCGNTIGSNRQRKPRKQPRDHYSPNSYGRAISYGIEAANRLRIAEARAKGIDVDRVDLIPHWHPHQLRHNAATFLRREHGIEVARIILGHKSAAITEVYAEADHATAINVMAEVG